MACLEAEEDWQAYTHLQGSLVVSHSAGPEHGNTHMAYHIHTIHTSVWVM